MIYYGRHRTSNETSMDPNVDVQCVSAVLYFVAKILNGYKWCPRTEAQVPSSVPIYL